MFLKIYKSIVPILFFSKYCQEFKGPESYIKDRKIPLYQKYFLTRANYPQSKFSSWVRLLRRSLLMKTYFHQIITKNLMVGNQRSHQPTARIARLARGKRWSLLTWNKRLSNKIFDSRSLKPHYSNIKGYFAWGSSFEKYYIISDEQSAKIFH